MAYFRSAIFRSGSALVRREVLVASFRLFCPLLPAPNSTIISGLAGNEKLTILSAEVAMGTDQDVIPADTVVIENRLCLWIGITVMLVGLGFVLLIYFIDAENPDAVPVPVRVFSFGTFAAIPLLGLIVVLLSENSHHIEIDRLIV